MYKWFLQRWFKNNFLTFYYGKSPENALLNQTLGPTKITLALFTLKILYLFC